MIEGGTAADLDAAAASAAPAYRVESPAVVRIAGLPVTVLDGLRCETTLRTVTELLDLEAALAAQSRQLSQRLYDAIGALHDHPRKPVLIGLRRAIHNRRQRHVAGLAEQVEGILPPALSARIRRLAEELERHDRGIRELRHILSEEVAAKLSLLRDVAGDPRLRHGLVQSGSGLDEALQRWLARPARRAPPRPVLFRLATYLSRIVTKTSPNSTFTTFGLARWVDDGPALRFREDVSPCGVFSLDVGLLQEIEQALGARPDLRGGFRVRVNPSALPTAAGLCFLGPPPEEPIVTIAATPEVTACLELAGERPWRTLDELRRRLAATADGPEAAGRSHRYLDRLIEVGLLELRLGVADQALDPLGDIARHLETAAGGRYRDVARLCRDLRAEIVTPTEPGEVDGHRTRLAAVASQARSLDEALGLGRQGAEVIRYGVVQENVVFPQPIAECYRRSWRAALDDLDAVRRWMGLHDPQLPVRLALGSYCRERFGAATRVPFLRFHQALEEDLRGAVLPDAESASLAELWRRLRVWGPPPQERLPRLVELERRRLQAVCRVVDRAPDDDGVIRVEPGLLLEDLEDCPAYVTAPPSVACYVQPLMRAAEPCLVLNAMISGYGRGRGRWLHLVRSAARATGAEAPADALAAVDEPEVLSAESRGAFGTALNLRPPMAGYEIDYPYVVGDGPAKRQIALRDLVVVHDPQSDTLDLRYDRTGTRVRPVHGGMMVEFLLPPALKLLVRGFSSPTLHYPSIPFLLRYAAATPLESVIALPRVEVGRVTLRRASWLVPRRLVPRRRKGQTDADYLLGLHRWLRREGIPLQCFVRSLRSDSAAGVKVRGSKWRKPLFIDFANWFLLTVFERRTRAEDGADNELIVLEEALPAPEEALAPGPSHCELIVEVTEHADG
jgi:hypothetical protein